MLGKELANVPRVLAGPVDVGGARADALVDDLRDRLAEVAHLERHGVEVGGRLAGHGHELASNKNLLTPCGSSQVGVWPQAGIS